MDERLVSWGRAVKSRNRRIGWELPPLWLFSDDKRSPDVVEAVRHLPKGLCGVVLRHDGVAGRAQLARQVWQVCRARRLVLAVAGERVGGGPWCRHMRARHGGACSGARTGSAHGVAELVRLRRAGVDAAFLSPAFATASHIGAGFLGALRWSVLSRRVAGVRVLALGGVDGSTARGLPRSMRGAGAIGALSPVRTIVASAPQCPAIAMGRPV